MDVKRMQSLGIEKCLVYLDGVGVEQCIEADEEQGYVITRHTECTKAGIIDVSTQRHEGKVEIFIVKAPEEA